MRNAYIAAGIGVLVVAAVLGYRALRDGAAPQPSPTAALGSPTASPTPTLTASPVPATPTPTQAASPSPAGSYVSAPMGYAMDVKPPWHRAVCGSSSSGPLEGSDGVDLFIAIPDRDFEFTDIGPAADNIQVSARANPRNLSYREWKSMFVGGSVSESIEDVTFAGRSALLIADRGSETFLVSNAGYMYAVGHQVRTGGTALADRAAIVRSFRFLSAAEAQAARGAATPRPAARSAETVADVLAEGFAKRDTTILATVISPRCVSEGANQAGATSRDPQSYLERLRDRFAKGLAVEVRPRPISTERGPTLSIRATWREPGQADHEVDLLITPDGSTHYWNGVIHFLAPR
jgi:hypothetical protein